MKALTLFKQFIRRLLGIADIYKSLDESKMLTAKLLINQMKLQGVYPNIHETEFKVFSQFGDDGIIQYLINNIDISSRHQLFIEFGVENYTESNTRFLLINNNWKGLVIDANQSNIDYIKNDEIYWRYDITAICSFIDRDNINSTISDLGFSDEIGVLSIDIDGNDYWIWESITSVNPIIVIVEYNSIFGKYRAVTIPYNPSFYRTNAHYSNLYWGCSLKALCLLGEKKGYLFVGCNSNGNNAYFVRKDKISSLKSMSAEAGYVMSKFRDSRDAEGRLSYIGGDRRLQKIKDMTVYDVERETMIKIEDF